MSDLSKIIKHIRVETTWLPTLDIPDPFRPGAPGPPNPLLTFLKPKITVAIEALGQQKEVVSSPYGDPGPSRWPVLQTVLLGAAVGALGYLAYRKFVR